jgi:hypothetical protein
MLCCQNRSKSAGMQWVTQSIWWIGNALLLALIYRGMRESILRQYPWFYAYIGFVLLSSLVGFALYRSSPDWYLRFYWISEFVSAVLGSLLTWEAYRRVLWPYPGVRRVASWMFVFVTAIAFASAVITLASGRSLIPTSVELERNLRTMQALALFAFIAAQVYYAIPMGKNLFGITTGYAFYVASRIINLSLRSQFGASYQTTLQWIQPVEYCATLAVWCVTLWSCHPGTRAAVASLDADYEWLSGRALAAFSRIRSSLGNVVR